MVVKWETLLGNGVKIGAKWEGEHMRSKKTEIKDSISLSSDIGSQVFEEELLATLNPRQRSFVRNCKAGMSITDSYFSAGYMSTASPTNRKDRTKACRGAYALATKNKAVKQLLESCHSTKDNLNQRDVVNRLYQIATGTITVELQSRRNGKKMLAPPSFKDQAGAAKVLLSWVKYLDSRPTQKEEINTQLSNELMAESLRLIQGESEIVEEEKEEEDIMDIVPKALSDKEVEFFSTKKAK